MGFAYNDAGKFQKNLGPLSKAGGERRLNVAVTRAREEIVFVSSVRAADMDLSGSRSEGAHLLKAYLEYVENGVDSLAKNIDSFTGECDSPFEAEVAAALVNHGLNPIPQVGCAGFRIDLAMRHPDQPGEFCLGIECDGATYHSSKTARDRDRVRQSVLESLGWKIIRVWSTDWVRNPKTQIERILDAYDNAVSGSPPVVKFPNSRTDDNNAELKPRFITHTESINHAFQKIDDVPDEEIRALAEAVLSRAGAIGWEDLLKQVTRELGFARTGRKIRERLESILEDELQSGKYRRVGDRVTQQSETA